MKVRFQKLTSEAITPTKAHPTDAGFDMYAVSREVDSNGNYVYSTGIAMEIPEGHVGLLFPRSSVSKKNQIQTNCVGVIDSSYRGDIIFKFKPIAGVMKRHFFGNDCDEIYDKGERIGQLIIMPYPSVELEEADALSDTDRGQGGFGSTGK